jgi:hypothetical protein
MRTIGAQEKPADLATDIVVGCVSTPARDQSDVFATAPELILRQLRFPRRPRSGVAPVCGVPAGPEADSRSEPELMLRISYPLSTLGSSPFARKTDRVATNTLAATHGRAKALDREWLRGSAPAIRGFEANGAGNGVNKPLRDSGGRTTHRRASTLTGQSRAHGSR